MIILKTSRELQVMKKACRISAGAFASRRRGCPPGITTKEIDRIVHDYIVKHGAKPSFLGYSGFPGKRMYFC